MGFIQVRPQLAIMKSGSRDTTPHPYHAALGFRVLRFRFQGLGFEVFGFELQFGKIFSCGSRASKLSNIKRAKLETLIPKRDEAITSSGFGLRAYLEIQLTIININFTLNSYNCVP